MRLTNVVLFSVLLNQANVCAFVGLHRVTREGGRRPFWVRNPDWQMGQTDGNAPPVRQDSLLETNWDTGSAAGHTHIPPEK